MLYTRSSFVKWLVDVNNCEVYPIKGTNVMIIENGVATAKMWVVPNDRIDYEEIRLLCQKLWLGLPGDKDLKKAK